MSIARLHGLPKGTHRCAWCAANWQGWEDVHLLITDTGLEFCSEICRERFEDANDVDVRIVAESGSRAVLRETGPQGEGIEGGDR